MEINNLGHITVYLPAFHDRFLLQYFKQIPEVKWEVFSKHTKIAYSEKNVSVQPINNHRYNLSLAGSAGLFTGGGFEGPAEALFLNKKVLVFPMKFQYEQMCNAEAVRRLGISTINQVDGHFVSNLKNWIYTDKTIKVNFSNETASIVDDIINRYARKS